MTARLKALMNTFKRELNVYRLVLADPRTPWPARIFLGAAIGYFLSPIDLIPDAIPVLGQLDDLLIVPGLLWMAHRFIPKDLLIEHREKLQAQEIDG